MSSNPSVCRLACCRLSHDPARSEVSDPLEALARVESLQRELSTLGQTIMAPTAPLSMAERTAASKHCQVIAASLILLHSFFVRVASDEAGHVHV